MQRLANPILTAYALVKDQVRGYLTQSAPILDGCLEVGQVVRSKEGCDLVKTLGTLLDVFGIAQGSRRQLPGEVEPNEDILVVCFDLVDRSLVVAVAEGDHEHLEVKVANSYQYLSKGRGSIEESA